MATQPNPLPQTGFFRLPPEIGLRLSQSLGDEENNTNKLITIDKTTFSQGVIPFGGSFGYSESKNEPW